jgi:hypothetical protein
MRAQRCRGETHHAVADRGIFDPGADRAHDAGAFEPEGRAGKAVDQSLFRQEPHRPHHVAEIEACGVHLDLDLARPDRLRGNALPVERVEPAGVAAPQGQEIRHARPTRRQTAAHPKRVTALGCPDDLVGLRGSGQFGGNLPGTLFRRCAAGKVEQAHRQAGKLVYQHARQTPQRRAHRADRLLPVGGLLRVTGDDPKR